MKNILLSFFFVFIIISYVYSQSVKYMIPDSGYQGTNFPVIIIGAGTEWMVSNYFQIYFDSTGVTATWSALVSDTMITGNVNISGKAVTIPRGIYVLDKFSNVYTKDSALKVLLSIPAVPILIFPPNNATNQFQNVTLLWDSNAYATSFRVQLSTDSAFSTTYFDSVVVNTPLQMRPNFLELGAKYFWRVNATNALGTSDWSTVRNFTIRTIGIKRISSEIPNSFKLLNNYPNPFNPVTKIRFQIPKTSYVEIKIFDITGKNLTTLVSQVIKEGTYEYIFDASSLPSGIYFVKMQAENYMGVNRIALIK
ncbi:MAG: T9SS type A sorting domain-containing protein [Ignavibacteriae bacterium]|nr:T9SS type A sorting domain-containing protein [Ignavibacteriota bacterium]